MREKTSGRQGLGILESAAIVLAIAVASLAMAQAQPGLPGCAVAAASVNRDAVPASQDAEATDMLLHD
ncbi:hypothetical protein EN851_32720 [Mesorhizobium sp. M8A.F.Ca.ET.208.01.1.1]|uniref:hypothetical protein n=1 Tax=unclassified Mesorhizobium TaxID=325217 RepID=UPI0010923823|nr:MULTISPECIES: hypothetical protein [unclassified Mesorhizobium]TGQ85708.1 hypothetical protein EN851_32720 [Mesorhizobium sp. M8A.F.Ca.ET.208.01.1.1]TGT47594.1 hypothetical protein EN810_32615 [Mesorhizobium sp. M8A.F.Ca.ET.167.01.1.1]TGV12543.1 hypothetical protein EN816_20235 [Mesorhizobium sp. M8A.F.Ca.ET.173.01.1.1]TIU48801.1 MAG: hypothetical protein E5W19_16235 [Mesorhizobium sp.]